MKIVKGNIKSDQIIKKITKKIEGLRSTCAHAGNVCCRFAHRNTCKQDVGVVGEEDVDVHAAGFESRCWQDFAAASTQCTAVFQKGISTAPARAAAASLNLLLVPLPLQAASCRLLGGCSSSMGGCCKPLMMMAASPNNC